MMVMMDKEMLEAAQPRRPYIDADSRHFDDAEPIVIPDREIARPLTLEDEVNLAYALGLV